MCRYVLCNSCKSPDTLLDRDSATRIISLRCQQVFTCLSGVRAVVSVLESSIAVVCIVSSTCKVAVSFFSEIVGKLYHRALMYPPACVQMNTLHL